MSINKTTSIVLDNRSTAIEFYEKDQPYNFLANTFHNDNDNQQIITNSSRIPCLKDFTHMIVKYGDQNITYKTSEHYYQSGKAINRTQYDAINDLPSGFATQHCVSHRTGDCKKKNDTSLNCNGLNITYDNTFGIFWDSSKNCIDTRKNKLPNLEQPTWWKEYKCNSHEILPRPMRGEMDYKCARMFNALLLKYGMDTPGSKLLREHLCDTNDRMLIEHTVVDGLWGDCGVYGDNIYYKCNSTKPSSCKPSKAWHRGCNYLGRMLTVIRHIYRNNPNIYIDKNKEFYDYFFIKGVHPPTWGGGKLIPNFTFTSTTGTARTGTTRTGTARTGTARTGTGTGTTTTKTPNTIQKILDYQTGNRVLPDGSPAPSYTQALDEIKKGAKTSHWMWYIFPILLKMRISEGMTSVQFKNLDELETYLLHPELSKRLIQITKEAIKHIRPEFSTLINLFRSSGNSKVDVIKFKQAMIIYLLCSANLILKNLHGTIQLTPNDKKKLTELLDICSQALTKMGVKDIRGRLEINGETDGDLYLTPNYFITKIKEDFDSEIQKDIDKPETINDFKTKYLDMLTRVPQMKTVDSRTFPSRTSPSRTSPSNVYQYPPIKFMLVLDGNVLQIKNLQQFKTGCEQDIATLLQIPGERVQIVGPIKTGSIKMNIEIINRPNDDIIRDIEIVNLLKNQQIHGYTILNSRITQKQVLTLSERQLIKEKTPSFNTIHLDVKEPKEFDMKNIKTVVSKTNNDYVITYDLSIPGLTELNHKEKEVVIQRFLGR